MTYQPTVCAADDNLFGEKIILQRKTQISLDPTK
jgi:hypothetical protein